MPTRGLLTSVTLRVAPALDRKAGHIPEHTSAEPGEDALERYVVLVHPAKSRLPYGSDAQGGWMCLVEVQTSTTSGTREAGTRP